MNRDFDQEKILDKMRALRDQRDMEILNNKKKFCKECRK